MRTFFISLLILISTWTYSQSIPEFSDLSSRNILSTTGFHSLQIPDGILYYISNPGFSRKLYKVNFDGILVDSTEFNTDGYTYTGQLYTSEGRFFLIGNAYVPFTSWLQSSKEDRRSIVEFDENLDIIKVNRYDLLPSADGLGLGVTESFRFQVGSGSTLVQPLDAQHLKEDTMMMTREYILFDTLTFQSMGKSQRLEKVVLGDTVYTIKILSQYLEQYQGAAIVDDSIYVYASASDCCDGVLFDFTSVGVFNANGDWARKIAILPQPNGLLDVAYDANGIYMNGKIFTRYTDVINAYSPACVAAVMDIRDTKFNLLRRAKVPLCGFYTSGTKCFAAVDNTIYFQTSNNDGDIGLCKYDTLLNLQWSRIYEFDQSHLAISVNATPDGGCIIEAVTGPNQDILKLYKINAAGNIVSFTSFPIAPVSAVTVYPNPFVEWIRIEGVTEPNALIELYDIAGRLCQTATLHNQSVQINAILPSGMYQLAVRSAKSNQILHTQKLTKR